MSKKNKPRKPYQLAVTNVGNVLARFEKRTPETGEFAAAIRAAVNLALYPQTDHEQWPIPGELPVYIAPPPAPITFPMITVRRGGIRFAAQDEAVAGE